MSAFHSCSAGRLIMEDTLPHILGRGRSGFVYRQRDAQGRDIARKVFGGDKLARIVNLVLTGAPNPYIWCKNAIRTATLRRQILTQMVEYWMPGQLRVADAYSWAWDDHHRAYELRTQFVNARHAALEQPFSDPTTSEHRDLYRHVIDPLQRHLTDAGFTGLLWQAGLGNPVAMNNFVIDRDASQTSWVWIDLESGVPALFPANPIKLLRFYLPQALRRCAPLFDDVDIGKLRAYIDDQRAHLGPDRAASLTVQIDELQTCQHCWKSLRRVERSVTYRLKQGRISPSQAEWYVNHTVLWYSREIAIALPLTAWGMIHLLARVLRRLFSLPYPRYAQNVFLFVTSQKFRSTIAARFADHRIDHWRQRGQLNEEHVAVLRQHLDHEDASVYVCDFGMHLALKPVVKATTYALIPMAVAAGLLGPHWVFIAIITFGAAARTLYTVGRLMQATIQRREKPWAALFIGVLPSIGNLAYPIQIIYCGTERGHELARFILYDSFARIGQRLPIWGGPDTLTEHLFNRLPGLLIRRFASNPKTPATHVTPSNLNASESDPDASKSCLPAIPSRSGK